MYNTLAQLVFCLFEVHIDLWKCLKTDVRNTERQKRIPTRTRRNEKDLKVEIEGHLIVDQFVDDEHEFFRQKDRFLTLSRK